MRIQMFSNEWFEKFMEKINLNANYEKLAADWEGDIAFVVLGDEKSSILRKGESRKVKLELFHGKCRSVTILQTVSSKEIPFILEGTVTVWEGILSGKINVITAMLKGDIRVTGDVGKLVKYVNAAQELVKSAKGIDSVVQ